MKSVADFTADQAKEAPLYAFLQAARGDSSIPLEPVRLNAGDTLRITVNTSSCLFIRSGAVASFFELDDGRLSSSRVNTCGDVLGLSALCGARQTEQKLVVLLPGYALRAPMALARRQCATSSLFATAILQLAGSQLTDSELLATCNLFHSVEARIAALLTKLLRYWEGPLPLTQETIASVLGVQRTSVSLVMVQLQQQGLLETSRGIIRVRRAAALQALARDIESQLGMVS